MIYLLNEKLHFNADEKTLFEDNSDTIKLTRIESELLLLLIKNNNNILTTDFLIREVWEKNGTYGSINNLNNYISKLRRNLKLFFDHQIIFTQKKIGFKTNFSSINIINDDIDENIINNDIEKNIIDLKTKTKTKIIMLIIPIIILALYFLQINHSMGNIKINNCNISDLGKSPKSLNEYKADIENYLSISKDKCFEQNSSFVYLKKKEYLILESPKKSILTVCNKNDICHVNIFNESEIKNEEKHQNS